MNHLGVLLIPGAFGIGYVAHKRGMSFLAWTFYGVILLPIAAAHLFGICQVPIKTRRAYMWFAIPLGALAMFWMRGASFPLAKTNISDPNATVSTVGSTQPYVPPVHPAEPVIRVGDTCRCQTRFNVECHFEIPLVD